MPRVAMNGITFRRVIASPLINPTSPPTSTPAATAVKGLYPSRNVTAVTTPVSAIAEPNNRSMPPLTMMIVMPIAPSATITVWASTMRRLRTDRYCAGASLISAKTAMTRISPNTGARRISQRLVAVLLTVLPSQGGRVSGPYRRRHHRFRRPLANRARRRQPAAAHHRERVAQPEQLGQIRADHQHRLALTRHVDD